MKRWCVFVLTGALVIAEGASAAGSECRREREKEITSYVVGGTSILFAGWGAWCAGEHLEYHKRYGRYLTVAGRTLRKGGIVGMWLGVVPAMLGAFSCAGGLYVAVGNKLLGIKSGDKD